ncbi:MAG: tail fiber domain-containing protein [Gemmatimonadetes bacterium]|nr:tail fiber domain-containing protein [Gemmatimonadota bacterium]
MSVLIASDGQLGTVSSSRRVKEDIRDMGESSRRLLQLRPVRFRYIQASADGAKPLQYGLIAEEVAEVYPELVTYDATGEPTAVMYHVLPALLLNELQRQERELAALRQVVEDLRIQLQSRRR